MFEGGLDLSKTWGSLFKHFDGPKTINIKISAQFRTASPLCHEYLYRICRRL